MRCNYCGLAFQELGEGVYDDCPYCTPRGYQPLPDRCYDNDEPLEEIEQLEGDADE